MRRWLIFILLGYPLQLLVYLLYPLACIWFLLSQYKPKSLKWPTIPEIKPAARHYETRDGGVFLKNTDDHGAFTHIFYWLHEAGARYFEQGMHLLLGQGEMCCRFLNDRRHYHKVSGDVAVFNMHAVMILQEYYGISDHLKKLTVENAKNYLKNLGFKSDKDGKRFVSARCNNFGLNFCPDGWGQLGQPAFGPQFYTSSAVFAAAARFGGLRWKLIYWAHWFLMGGWYWWAFPVLYTKKDKLAYVRDVTIRAAHTVKLSGMGTWFEGRVEHYIGETVAEVRNPMHWALRGKAQYGPLPEVINPWCFQTIDCDNGDEPSANGYTLQSLPVITAISRRF